MTREEAEAHLRESAARDHPGVAILSLELRRGESSRSWHFTCRFADGMVDDGWISEASWTFDPPPEA